MLVFLQPWSALVWAKHVPAETLPWTAEPWLSQTKKHEIVNLSVLQVPEGFEWSCNLSFNSAQIHSRGYKEGEDDTLRAFAVASLQGKHLPEVHRNGHSPGGPRDGGYQPAVASSLQKLNQCPGWGRSGGLKAAFRWKAGEFEGGTRFLLVPPSPSAIIKVVFLSCLVATREVGCDQRGSTPLVSPGWVLGTSCPLPLCSTLLLLPEPPSLPGLWNST